MIKSDRTLTPEEKALVQNNVALAKFLYAHYLGSFQRKADFGVDPDDLLSQAYYGLIRAAMRYRAYGEEHGYSEESIASGQYFSVFARKSIIGQMLDFLRKVDHVHPLIRRDYKLLLECGLGSSQKTEDELSEESGLTVARIQKVIHMVRSRPVYLDDSAGGDSEQTVGDSVTSYEDVESSAAQKAICTAMVEDFDSLSDLHKTVIVLKYYVGFELSDVSKTLGLSLQSVRNSHTEAILEMYEVMHERAISMHQ